MAQFTLKDLALIVDAKLHGDASCVINGIGDVQNASASEITFISNKKYLPELANSGASAVLLAEAIEDAAISNQLIVKDPYLAYAKLSVIFDTRPKTTSGIHPSAVVDPTAIIGSNVRIAANCVVEAGVKVGDNSELCAGVVVGGNAVIGADCLLHANVTIAHHCVLGQGVKIHSGTTIGSDGFGYAPSREEGWVKIHQNGRVVIGNNVEIGANCAIDRGAIKDTIIKDGVIIDNLVHIAHNVVIGERTAIAGCVGIAGSTELGAGCTMGGFVAINGHLKIADNVHFNGGTIVTKSISEAGHYASGSPMQDVRTWRKNMVRVSQLDEWVGRIKKLESQ